MFLRVFFLIYCLCLHLNALELKSEYILYGLDFNASTIDSSITEDFKLYQFEKNRFHKSLTSSKLIQTLQKHGLEVNDKSKGIVHLTRHSKLDYTPLEDAIKQYYLHYFPKMHIQEIIFKQGSYIQALPDDYELIFKKSAYLYSRSNLQIISKKQKIRHFLSYEIKARLKLFKASHNINRGKILSQIDLSYEEVAFERLKGLPLQKVLTNRYRPKKRLASGKIIYLKDIEKLPLVVKNKRVNVRLVSGNVRLEFQAMSLQDGHIGDEISIKKHDGKRLKAKVIGTNLVEIQ